MENSTLNSEAQSPEILIKSESGKYLFKGLLILFSFLLPLGICLILFAENGFYPFSNNGSTILMIDSQSQYIAFYRYYKAVLESNQTLVYTMSTAFGGNFSSLYAYYLASPFNLLIRLCSYEAIPAFLLFTSIIKMSLAGLNMCLLICLSHKKFDLISLLFAVCYALSSYSFVYLSNFMWLDGVMILPLVVLGINLIFEKKHYWLYPIALAYSLYTSWYIGAMECIFSVLYFIYKLLSVKRNKKESLNFFIYFSIFSIAGGLIAASAWIPSFAHFSDTKVTSSFPKAVIYPFSMILKGFLEDGYTSVSDICQNEGFLTMFTSDVTLVFFILFFVNKGKTRRERLWALGLFGFYIVCASSSVLNTLLHGGRTPSWFPGRYSFIIGFIVSYFGSSDCQDNNKVPYWGFLLPVLICYLTYLVVLFVPSNSQVQLYSFSIPGLLIFCSTLALSVIYKFLSTYKPLSNSRRIYVTTNIVFSLAIISLGSYSSYRGANRIVTINSTQQAYQEYSKYEDDCAFQSDVDNIKSLDSTNNYRMEMTFLRPGNYNSINNNPYFYNYKGVSCYSSTDKKSVQNYMSYVGFQNNSFFQSYDGGSTLAINSLFNIRYLIDDSGDYSTNKPQFIDNYPMEKITDISSQNENIVYYKNPYALPLGFEVNRMSDTFITEGADYKGKGIKWFDHFQYQNAIFSTLCPNIKNEDGTNKEIFKPIDFTIETSGTEYTENELDQLFFSGGANSSVSFNFTIPEKAYSCNLYFGLKELTGDLTVRMDDLKYNMASYWHQGLRGFKDNSSHTHTLDLSLNTDYNSREIRPEIYYEDTDVLNEYITALKANGANDLTEFSTSSNYGYQGNFNLKSDSDSFLFTLPYESNMSIYIDGVKRKTFLRMNIFTACDLEGLEAGLHSVKIVYQDNSIVLGDVLSLLSAGGLVAFVVITTIKNKKKENKKVGD